MNKIKQVEAETKLNDHITSYTKLINNLSRRSLIISTKKLTQKLLNEYSFFIGKNYFDNDRLLNYWIFQFAF